MRMNVDEKTQILYMQTRMVRLASEQWRRSYCERKSSLILELKAKIQAVVIYLKLKP